MKETVGSFVDAEAIKELIGWKAFFATEVARHARQLAADSQSPGVITVAHY